jgi:Na+-transporting NADH:ubiquinone oxidoreductase subunit NqrD
MVSLTILLLAGGAFLVIGLLIYLIAKRMEEKKNEKFEKRDY